MLLTLQLDSLFRPSPDYLYCPSYNAGYLYCPSCNAGTELLLTSKQSPRPGSTLGGQPALTQPRLPQWCEQAEASWRRRW